MSRTRTESRRLSVRTQRRPDAHAATETQEEYAANALVAVLGSRVNASTPTHPSFGGSGYARPYEPREFEEAEQRRAWETED